jgi:hypothetical protein
MTECAANVLLSILCASWFASVVSAEQQPQSASPEIKEQSTSLPTNDVLARVRHSIDSCYKDFSNLVFHERIERYKGREADERGELVDVINSTVLVAKDTEEYSDIYRNKKAIKSIAGLPGAWSSGGYTSMLLDVKNALFSGKIDGPTVTTFNGVPALLFTFDVMNGSGSSWEFRVNSTRYLLPFHAEVWALEATGDILKISRRSLLTPPGTGIKELIWSLQFFSADLNGTLFRLPNSGFFGVAYTADNHREWNLLSLSAFRRFGVESTVRYR